MNEPSALRASEINPAAMLESDIDEAIALSGSDARAALRATMLANRFLEEEGERLSQAVCSSFARGKVRRWAKPGDEEKKAG